MVALHCRQHCRLSNQTQLDDSLTLCKGIANGYPTFVISIAAVGVCTAVIGDVAGHLGCFIYLKDCVNAIAFVALGTSVPGQYQRSRSLYGDLRLETASAKIESRYVGLDNIYLDAFEYDGDMHAA